MMGSVAERNVLGAELEPCGVDPVTGFFRDGCCTDQSLDALLLRLNPVVRGWCGYFRPGVSYATFAYLGHYLWFRVWHWLRRKHPRITWKDIRRRYFRSGSWPASHSRVLLNPTTVGTSRYRYRGAAIPTPWPATA